MPVRLGLSAASRNASSVAAVYDRRNPTFPSVLLVAPLEVNPFLTISALTERIVENIVVSLTH